MNILLLLLLIHVCGAKCHTELSTHHIRGGGASRVRGGTS